MAFPEGKVADVEAGHRAGPGNPSDLGRLEREECATIFLCCSSWQLREWSGAWLLRDFPHLPHMMGHHVLSRNIKPLSFALHFPETWVWRGPLPPCE